MKIDVSEEPIAAAPELVRIPIAFEVSSIFEAAAQGNRLNRFLLSERKLEVPYTKDYDGIKDEGPTQWAKRFDVSHWGLIGARSNEGRIGAVVIAFKTSDLRLLEGRSDIAALWDIRIHPSFRRKGVGSVLFKAAEAWAKARGCRQLKVETQNINVPACRFYERQGCVLSQIDRSAYPEFPDEMQMLWYKDL